MPMRHLLCCLLAVTAANAVTVDLQPVSPGLTNMMAVTHAGDDSGRLFISLRAGRIKIHDGTQLLPANFLDISSLVSTDGERGLLSTAFHPGYTTNGLFFVCYTNLAGDIVLARYTRSVADPNLADAGTALIVLTVPHPGESNHNGGQIQFGPDGYLYLATGDGGGGCDSPNNSQNLNSLLGKLLRLDVTTATPYAIPPTNPFVGVSGARPEIWAYGLRNTWRFSFDRRTGDLFLADVGQNQREEVNLQPAASPGGENYGWRLYEGLLTNTCSVTFSNVPTTAPIFDYPHTLGFPCYSITGGYRYRGSRITPLFGAYVYGDYCGGAVWGATTNAGGAWTSTPLLTRPTFTLTTFGEDERGELYVANYSNATLYRLVWKDTDTDGMADDWETDHLFNPGNPADAPLDTDTDGYTNLQEFLAGTDPRDPASALRITAVEPAGTVCDISFTTVADKLYRLERAPALPASDWDIVTNNVTGTGAILTLPDTPLGTDNKRLYRVRLLP